MTACFNHPDGSTDFKASLLSLLKRCLRSNEDLAVHEPVLTMLALRGDKESNSANAQEAIFLLRELALVADKHMLERVLMVSIHGTYT